MKPNYRRCISCRKVDLKGAFWRVVRLHPSGQLQLDGGMGRSAYICPQESCLQAAQKKNRLGKALKAAVPPEIYQTLWQRLSTQPDPANSTFGHQTASDSSPGSGDESLSVGAFAANPEAECQNSKQSSQRGDEPADK